MGPTAVVIIEKQNKFLVSKRAAHLKMYPGCWAAPGGHLNEKDRDIMQTAQRECLEETSLFIPRKYLCFYDEVITELGTCSVFLCTRCPITTIMNTEPDKRSDWKWRSAAELLSLPMIPALEKYISEYTVEGKVKHGSEKSSY